MALHFDYASAAAPTSSKRPAPTATRGSSYTAPLALRFLYSFTDMKEIGTFGQVKITVTVTIALLVITTGAVLAALYALFPDYRKLLEFGAAVIGGASGIYSAFYVGQSLQAQTIQDKKHRSFELMGQFTDIDFTKIRAFLESNIKSQQIAPAAMYKKITDEESIDTAVKTALNWFETLSIAIQEDYVDEDILYSLLSYSVPFYFKSLEPYIEQHRKNLDYQKLYIELEKLYKAWTSQKYLSNGRTIKQIHGVRFD